MVKGAMAEGEGGRALWPLGANLGRPLVGRGPPATRGEVGGQETFLSRP